MLLEQELLKLLMMHEGSKYMNVVDSIIANAMTSSPDVSQGLSTKDKEELSCLYLEVGTWLEVIFVLSTR